jgi:hypothetical protein
MNNNINADILPSFPINVAFKATNIYYMHVKNGILIFLKNK